VSALEKRSSQKTANACRPAAKAMTIAKGFDTKLQVTLRALNYPEKKEIDAMVSGLHSSECSHLHAKYEIIESTLPP
jgi:hypothetical protein